MLDFHVLFNVTLAVLFIFLTDRGRRGWCRGGCRSPTRPSPRSSRGTWTAARSRRRRSRSSNAAREVLRIGDTVEQMLHGMLRVIRTNDSDLVAGIVRLEDDIDRLYTAVKLYLTQISREALDEKEGARWSEIMQLTINLEHVGDILEGIMRDLRDKKIAHRLMFSDEGMREIEELHAKLIANLRLGLSVFLSGDLRSAQMLLAEKETLPGPRAGLRRHPPRPAGRPVGAGAWRPARCTWTSSATCAASIPSSARRPIRSSSRRASCGAAGCAEPRKTVPPAAADELTAGGYSPIVHA